jgi:hypothetical protein
MLIKRFLLFSATLTLFVFSFSSQVQAKGTHFLIEPYSGVIFNQGLSKETFVGLESGALFAFGGKLKGFPPRFYLYFKGSQSYFGQDDVFIDSRQSTGTIRRSYTRFTMGVRSVIPLFWYVRLVLEIGGGGMFSENKYHESGVRLLEYHEDLGIMEVGLGFNLRLYSWLSVGLMYDYTFVTEAEYGDMIATIIGEANNGAELGWSHLTATVGFHF